jgi:hypothetical protein
VTTQRYLNYRRALDLLQVVDPHLVAAEDRLTLADVAEELLLTPSGQPAGATTTRLARCLGGLVETGGIEAPLADELWRTLCAAGPVAD